MTRSSAETFLELGLDGYSNLRNRPDHTNVSRLSPHLHFGEVSPRQIWSAVCAYIETERRHRKDSEKFFSELGWREIAYHLLYHFPDLPSQNWKRAFDAYPWVDNPSHLQVWQKGMTGYPLVDAGMRELWTTG